MVPPSYAKPSRSQLLVFFKDTFSIDVSKIDDLGNGAIYCQALDSIYGDVPMNRVNFETRALFEMQQNHKILQQVFLRHNIKYEFDSQKLMKCRFQDNLEFSQWIYQYWHDKKKIPDYDPVARRSGSGGMMKRLRNVPNPANPRQGSVPPSSTSFNAVPAQLPAPKASNVYMSPQPAQVNHSGLTTRNSFAPQPQASNQLIQQQEAMSLLKEENEMLQERIRALETENYNLNNVIEVVSTERAGYYEQLLGVESIVEDYLQEVYGGVTEDGENKVDSNKALHDPTMVLIRNIQVMLFNERQDEPF